MTHKEKAIELTTQMMLHQFVPMEGNGITESACHENAKECALITVDYILELSGTDNVRYTDSFFEYWRQVKIEIQKL